jgi:hypothetical protein
MRSAMPRAARRPTNSESSVGCHRDWAWALLLLLFSGWKQHHDLESGVALSDWQCHGDLFKLSLARYVPSTYRYVRSTYRYVPSYTMIVWLVWYRYNRHKPVCTTGPGTYFLPQVCTEYIFFPSSMYRVQPVPKAYRKCCVKCKMNCSHLKSSALLGLRVRKCSGTSTSGNLTTWLILVYESIYSDILRTSWVIRCYDATV